MSAAFEQTFRLDLPKRGKFKGKICWLGRVQINMKTAENPGAHLLRIVYPDKYPTAVPEAYCEKPIIEMTKDIREMDRKFPKHKPHKLHQYFDGELCLFQKRDGVSHGWNPSRSTGATIAGWAIQWLYAYYTWRATGDWPGLEESVSAGRRK